jgi:hypothetical protein
MLRESKKENKAHLTYLIMKQTRARENPAIDCGWDGLYCWLREIQEASVD